ncbi:MAG: EamA family transporter [Crocinitomicaceae bacterium]|nr:EamA family transporter [Crocinitomicaceae bacterium]
MDKFKAHFALLLANLIYGINYSVAKGVMPDYVKPFGFIFLRASGSVLLFWLISLAMKWEPIAKKDIPRMFLAGVFGVAVNQLLFFKGLNITHPINASIMMTSSPVLVLVISALLIKEKISARKVFGIVLGLTGAVLLILFKGGNLSGAPQLAFDSDTALGDALVMLNAISYGTYLVIVKPLMQRYSAVTVIRWVFTFGFCVVIPFGFGEFTEIEWVTLPTPIIWSIVFVVVGTTFLAYLLNIFALGKIMPSTASIYMYTQPLFATLIALYFGNDSLSITKIIAAVLIFVGVYFVSVKREKKTIEA